MTKIYRFYADTIIEAKNEEEAREKFADNSCLSENAEVEEVCEKHLKADECLVKV